jgi:hypothetical protein
MKYERFEQLPVWQAAIDLAAAVYAMTEKAPFRRRYSLRDQIERAAVSICNNIAEGFERGPKPGVAHFSLCRSRFGRRSEVDALPIAENPSLRGPGIWNLESEIAG